MGSLPPRDAPGSFLWREEAAGGWERGGRRGGEGGAQEGTLHTPISPEERKQLHLTGAPRRQRGRCGVRGRGPSPG